MLQIGATIMYDDMDYLVATYLQYYRKEMDEWHKLKNK